MGSDRQICLWGLWASDPSSVPSGWTVPGRPFLFPSVPRRPRLLSALEVRSWVSASAEGVPVDRPAPGRTPRTRDRTPPCVTTVQKRTCGEDDSPGVGTDRVGLRAGPQMDGRPNFARPGAPLTFYTVPVLGTVR